jgi:hypothetical protein
MVPFGSFIRKSTVDRSTATTRSSAANAPFFGLTIEPSRKPP